MVCVRHYVQFRKHGYLRPLKRRITSGTICAGPDNDGGFCGRPAKHWDATQLPHVPLCKSHAEQRRQVRLGLRPDALVPVRARSEAQPAQLRDDQGNKRCTTCQVWQPESEFWNMTQSGDGLAPSCKSCSRADRLARLFGITFADIATMLTEQGGACAICQEPFDESRSMVIDHDHSCCPGYKTCGDCIRGILCNACNSGLGWMRDSVFALLSAVEYLNRWQESRASGEARLLVSGARPKRDGL